MMFLLCCAVLSSELARSVLQDVFASASLIMADHAGAIVFTITCLAAFCGFAYVIQGVHKHSSHETRQWRRRKDSKDWLGDYGGDEAFEQSLRPAETKLSPRGEEDKEEEDEEGEETQAKRGLTETQTKFGEHKRARATGNDDDDEVISSGPSPNWSVLSALNYFVITLFVFSAAYLVVNYRRSNDISFDGSGGVPKVFAPTVVCCLCLAYFFGFFGISFVSGEISSFSSASFVSSLLLGGAELPAADTFSKTEAQEASHAHAHSGRAREQSKLEDMQRCGCCRTWPPRESKDHSQSQSGSQSHSSLFPPVASPCAALDVDLREGHKNKDQSKMKKIGEEEAEVGQTGYAKDPQLRARAESHETVLRHTQPHRATRCAYDAEVIVVGAGVAGAAAAISLARLGHSVVCIERQMQAPDRIVGELLQPGGVEALRKLGLGQVLEDPEVSAVLANGYVMVRPANEGRSYSHSQGHSSAATIRDLEKVKDKEKERSVVVEEEEEEEEEDLQFIHLPYPDRVPETFWEGFGCVDLRAGDRMPLLPTNGENCVSGSKDNESPVKGGDDGSSPSRPRGRGFHNHKFVTKLRQVAMAEPNLLLIEGTVQRLLDKAEVEEAEQEEEERVREEWRQERRGTKEKRQCERDHAASSSGSADASSTRVCGVEFRDSASGLTRRLRAPLTLVADGIWSSLRRHLSGGDVRVLSHFVGLVLEHDAHRPPLPVPGYGHTVLADPSPVLLYQISPTETRLLVDCPQLPRAANGDLQRHLADVIAPQLPRVTRDALRRALAQGVSIKSMPNRSLAAVRPARGGAMLLGDAWNMRHPLTGGGMTVALQDVLLLRDMLARVPGLDLCAGRARTRARTDARGHRLSKVHCNGQRQSCGDWQSQSCGDWQSQSYGDCQSQSYSYSQSQSSNHSSNYAQSHSQNHDNKRNGPREQKEKEQEDKEEPLRPEKTKQALGQEGKECSSLSTSSSSSAPQLCSCFIARAEALVDRLVSAFISRRRVHASMINILADALHAVLSVPVRHSLSNSHSRSRNVTHSHSHNHNHKPDHSHTDTDTHTHKHSLSAEADLRQLRTRQLLREGCFQYLRRGGLRARGPVGLLAGLTPRPGVLALHFFLVALQAIALALRPWPSPRALALSLSILHASCIIIMPLVQRERATFLASWPMQALVDAMFPYSKYSVDDI